MADEDIVQYRDVAYARVKADGTVITAVGCQPSRKADGTYNIELLRIVSGALPAGVPLPDAVMGWEGGALSGGAGGARIFDVASVDDANKTISIYTDSGALIDSDFAVTFRQVLL